MKRNYLDYIESYADFPKAGVIFWDFTPLCDNPEVFTDAIEDISSYFKGRGINKIVAIEAKGFIIGGALALKMGLPLNLIRKPNLIPGAIETKEFVKEYGQAEYQIKRGAIKVEEKVLIIYDILAAPGALLAAKELVERSGGQVVGAAVVIELEYLMAGEKLLGLDVFSLVKIKDKKLK